MKTTKICNVGKSLLLQYGLDDIDLKYVQRHEYEQGEFLSHAGQILDFMFFVISGKAKVYVNLDGGKQLLLAYITTKGILGDIELVTKKPTNYTTVQAITDFVCIALPLNLYSEKLRGNNIFINHVAKELATKLTQRVINSAITTLHPLDTRLCAYIIQTSCNGIFREQLTEVAITLGVSYRHLLRCLNKLCLSGTLCRDKAGYRIINENALKNCATDLYVI